jgi:signal transduction histidine kinase
MSAKPMSAKPVRTLESQLLRSSLVLMIWLSGLLAALIVALILYNAHIEQTAEGNLSLMEDFAEDIPEIRKLLLNADDDQSAIVLDWIRDQEVGEELPWYLAPSAAPRIANIDVTQWVRGGVRSSPTGTLLGTVPTHWQQAMARSELEIFTEPQGSSILHGQLRAFGAETLLVKIDEERTLAVVSPTRIFSNRELWAYGVLWVCLLWLGFLLSFTLIGFPVMYFLARRRAHLIATPLKQLSSAAEQFAQGATHTQVDAIGSAETQSLARSFNRMGEHWQQAREKEREALRKLESSNQSQRQFVSDVSHDLRTPLTAVLGYTERALRRLPDDPDLQVIARESEALKNLVTNLFEVAQGDLDAQSGTGALLRATQVEIRPLLEELVHSFAPQAWARGVLLRVAPAAADHHAVADRQRLGMALRNLIDNAVQHTEAGGLVELDVQALSGTLNSAGTMISVTDSGVGIAPELLPKIFDRGVRGDSARTRRGGGLGLAIVQQIMVQHGGRVEVTSVLGEGTQFRLVWGE